MLVITSGKGQQKKKKKKDIKWKSSESIIHERKRKS
jgi:hypothetical protein